MAVPPADMCAAYSGISRPLQECVMRDPRAREGVRRAVEELMLFMEQRRRISGTVEVAASVGCTAGTHRSVSIAEEIAAGLLTQVRRLGWEEGIKVVVRHVHRIRGPKDRF
jgi:RNase adaptor protein for sRNA GlmZ degradation